ncbi:XRE family transcriptional regulator [Mycobacterium frederiksbergense]|uniref:XRE family transcriptional regulator n=1 Tax=Mycolicibacterium frederiksbergense TaxID=117567 RepID=A0A6H0SC28_9MYCO|nr:XRE family transcriptional regulator [Mycolicibacterium frederiksbergense]MCV7048136.1 XRE family transcriptional regulator [Mycolicibacterium frederiksbergense]QIV84696.1 XRE family transcriptional regulator [Mycolicibacterium frederiksbergense]
MPRTDENGRQLKALLDYLLDGDVEAKDIYDALDISSSTYYRRIKESSYPDAEELRRVADRFALSYPDLQIRFGLMSRQEVWNYIESTPFTVTAVQDAVRVQAEPQQQTRRPKLSELTPRSDAPPL